jgi:hypothetical protein
MRDLISSKKEGKMKNFGNLKVLGLVTLLTLVLVIVGINSLEAQKKGKPDKPSKPDKESQYTWKVTIPGDDVAISLGYNLFGYYPQQGNIYEDKGEGDGIGVVVEKKSGGGGVESQFRLGVFNNINESGQCVPWEDGPKKIGFRDIFTLPGTVFANTAAEEYPCFFPPTYSPYSPYPCDDPDYGIGNAPYCMAAFLNNNLQPYCDQDLLCGHPECSYYFVEISIKVDCDFDNITQPNTTGIVWIKVINTFDLQSGCEYPHNISGTCPVEVPDGSLFIDRTDDKTWNITVDGTFTFTEIYKGSIGKGKRWEYKIPYWTEIPLKFVTTWTRHEVTQ